MLSPEMRAKLAACTMWEGVNKPCEQIDVCNITFCSQGRSVVAIKLVGQIRDAEAEAYQRGLKDGNERCAGIILWVGANTPGLDYHSMVEKIVEEIHSHNWEDELIKMYNRGAVETLGMVATKIEAMDPKTLDNRTLKATGAWLRERIVNIHKEKGNE